MGLAASSTTMPIYLGVNTIRLRSVQTPSRTGTLCATRAQPRTNLRPYYRRSLRLWGGGFSQQFILQRLFYPPPPGPGQPPPRLSANVRCANELCKLTTMYCHGVCCSQAFAAQHSFHALDLILYFQ
eukprot:1863815-Rhodomonas_salina.1